MRPKSIIIPSLFPSLMCRLILVYDSHLSLKIMVVGTSKILMAWSMAFEAYFLVLVEVTFHLVTLILSVNYMKKTRHTVYTCYKHFTLIFCYHLLAVMHKPTFPCTKINSQLTKSGMLTLEQ